MLEIYAACHRARPGLTPVPFTVYAVFGTGNHNERHLRGSVCLKVPVSPGCHAKLLPFRPGKIACYPGQSVERMTMPEPIMLEISGSLVLILV